MPQQQGSSAPWADPDKRFRLPVSAGSRSIAHNDKIAELAVNFNDLLSDVGSSQPFDPDSLRMVEIDGSGAAIDLDVPFQFDPDPGYNAADNAAGTLIWLVAGATPVNTARSFHLYFDDQSNGPYAPVAVTPLVQLTDNVQDAGQASLRIVTRSATYFYHKDGGGFSSLLDDGNHDWINHSSAEGSAGDFRGIPNLVFPSDGGYFHPGRDTATTRIIHQGPLKATFTSTAGGGAWQVTWFIYPEYASMVVQKAAGEYWFLYEGTPGGQVDNNDFIIRSNGLKTRINASWNGDLSPEWLAFTDEGIGQALFYAHHSDDNLVDSYYLMDGQMTVFGFGRLRANRYLTEVPNQFTIGLTDKLTFEDLGPVVNNAYNPLIVLPADAQSNPSGASDSQDVQLVAGWSLISSHIIPDQPAIETVLAGVVGNMQIIKNDAGEVYWPDLKINSIDNWSVQEGYTIFMDNADTLTITGSKADPAATPIPLSQGWNSVSYLPDSALPIDQALGSISGQLLLVKDGAGNLYWPAFGINQIGNMQPGFGYEIFVNAAATLLYP